MPQGVTLDYFEDITADEMAEIDQIPEGCRQVRDLLRYTLEAEG